MISDYVGLHEDSTPWKAGGKGEREGEGRGVGGGRGGRENNRRKKPMDAAGEVQCGDELAVR